MPNLDKGLEAQRLLCVMPVRRLQAANCGFARHERRVCTLQTTCGKHN